MVVVVVMMMMMMTMMMMMIMIMMMMVVAIAVQRPQRARRVHASPPVVHSDVLQEAHRPARHRGQGRLDGLFRRAGRAGHRGVGAADEVREEEERTNTNANANANANAHAPTAERRTTTSRCPARSISSGP